MHTKIITFVFCMALLSGCAGSANHTVVTAHSVGDTSLSCTQIDSEIVKAQVIIDGVNKDKDDISGADVIDGLLWFPFNLIAKSGNYNKALEAADKRIENLESMSEEKKCSLVSESERDKAALSLSNELKELNDLYKTGALTQEEYDVAKQKVLDNVGS